MEKAGQAIAAGGYGCVFKPPLQCADGTTGDKASVSKLMYTRSANGEMEELNTVKRHLDKIPDASFYFLEGNTRLCERPKPLSSADKRQFDHTCGNFNSITSDNVNERLDELAFITMPYGGPDMKEYWRNKWKSVGDFVETNNALVRLLVNAIIPLNNNKFYHTDIKAHNILRAVEGGNVRCRLIDWGLAGEIENHYEFFERFQYAVPQFNLPPSALLLRRDVREWLEPILEKSAARFPTTGGTHVTMRAIAQKLYRRWGVDEGHDSYMNDVFGSLFNTSSDDFVRNIHINYIASVLSYYTGKTGEFNARAWVHEVFSKNVDIYGFVTSYIPVLQTTRSAPFKNELLRILTKYCFGMDHAAKPISVPILQKELLALNDLVPKKAKAAAVPNVAAVAAVPKNVAVPNAAAVPKNVAVPNAAAMSTCPIGYERNPQTGNCVKTNTWRDVLMKGPCPPGKERNPKTGNCVKTKTKKRSVASLMKEPCPPGKERNPKTGNCVKTKTKKRSVASLMKEPCPPGLGLERNPKTGNCVKAKPKPTVVKPKTVKPKAKPRTVKPKAKPKTVKAKPKSPERRADFAPRPVPIPANPFYRPPTDVKVVRAMVNPEYGNSQNRSSSPPASSSPYSRELLPSSQRRRNYLHFNKMFGISPPKTTPKKTTPKKTIRRAQTKKKSVASLMKEPCPPGKERNPKTGRCVKTKAKTVKASVKKFNTTAVSKTCPPGHLRHLQTGECV